MKNIKVLDFEPLFSYVRCCLQIVLELSCVLSHSWGVDRKKEETPTVRPGKWRNGRKGDYEGHVDASSVHELLGSVDDLTVDDTTHQCELMLMEPGLKVFKKIRYKDIKKSNEANMN